MPQWTQEQIWQGMDVIIIGGGHSLQTFPWDMLKRELTIGCNAAYSLGTEVCSVVFFGDASFLKDKDHYAGLVKYGGPVFTNAPRLSPPAVKTSWLLTIPRQSEGLGETSVGWNGNTGAGAINLAFLFGARRVYLLGFDMHESTAPNWHELYAKKLREQRRARNLGKHHPYARFLLGFEAVARDWKAKFPDRQIINVNDNTALRLFPIITVAEFLKERANG